LCERRDCRLADLTREDFAAERAVIADDVRNVLGVENAVRAFQSAGSTALARSSNKWPNGVDGSVSPLDIPDRLEHSRVHVLSMSAHEFGSDPGAQGWRLHAMQVRRAFDSH
jgi:hypothetical protein